MPGRLEEQLLSVLDGRLGLQVMLEPAGILFLGQSLTHKGSSHFIMREGAYSSCRSSSNEELEMPTPHNPTMVRLEAAGFQKESIHC